MIDKKTKDKILDAFYLLGRYQAFSGMMLHELKDSATYDINKKMLDDLENEVNRLCNNEKIIR